MHRPDSVLPQPPRLKRRSVLAAAASLGMAWAAPAWAQALPADATIHLVVPTTPGSTPDVLARAIAPQLTRKWERTVVVENRIGASGSIGTEYVSRAAPNGTTLLMAASTLATRASLQANKAFDARRDLTPIVQAGWTRLVLVTHPGTGWTRIGDVITAARKAPGKYVYGSPGNGTPNHLAAELFKVKTGTFILHIPYRGSGPQITDVLGGQIDLAPITIIAAAPHVKAGKLVALAVTGSKRSALLPGLPSLAEAGVPGVEGDIWYGLFGPRGMAPELVARLNADVREALEAEARSFAAQGIDIETGTPQAFQQLLATDTARWTELVKLQGIKPD
ncbi:MAG: tripartite tricarboxylate transporter substrate binding protein [Burkholderiales bacterium]